MRTVLTALTPLDSPVAFLVLTSSTALAQDEVRITEWMYRGLHAEFIEITNLGLAQVDLTGWSLDDKSATPGTLDLSPLGVLAPGESALITEGDAALFAAEWGLAGVKILGGNQVAKLGRNDRIHLFDAQPLLHDAFSYGDEDFPGTLRARNVSGNACTEALGIDYVWSWRASLVGDGRGTVLSASGDLGAVTRLSVAYCVSSFSFAGSMCTPRESFCNLKTSGSTMMRSYCPSFATPLASRHSSTR